MRTAIEPVEFRADWGPGYTVGRGDENRDEAFTLADAEGMCCLNGAKVHGGWDVFAPAGTIVRAPFDCTVVRANESTDHYGGVYGGVIGLRQEGSLEGVVMRHVDPALTVGAKVPAGAVVAYVFDWYSGGDHVHLEWHRVIGSGYDYRFANMIDPGTVRWLEAGVEVPIDPAPVLEFGLEVLPMRLGGIGPDVYGGWGTRGIRKGQRPAVESRYAPGEFVVADVKLRGKGAPYGIRVTREGRPGIPRWLRATEAEREAVIATLAGSGLPVRKFRGRANSHYARLP